ncbi:hypothetical protein K431DRAFT_251336 [Polychaeton citri CBS 116435]|uniref:Pinin/SDK/MemA protein domain-containing protein n=1 Tax=Polychaeton citri CBS 116435 TaxID=1314669 RepID=A0A9P4Q537_9PEZI|nr:hypothetical protein K431DRAFT_251336 [Polychaeton citri CBS 116435]
MASSENGSAPRIEATGMKRRQSSVSEQQGNKRPRISPGKTSPDINQDRADGNEDEVVVAQGDTSSERRGDQLSQQQQQPSPDVKQRRVRDAVDAKERSRRLFGAALLGNVGQGNDRAAKRRQEIENRRKAELQRQDDERLEDKQRRLEQLHERRCKEQVIVDRDAMRARHNSQLHYARFLQTKAEPGIYYRPWELRPDEEELIDRQIDDMQDEIDQEIEEFDSRYGSERTQRNGPIQVYPSSEPASHDESPEGQQKETEKLLIMSLEKQNADTSIANAIQAENVPQAEELVVGTETKDRITTDSAADSKVDVLDDDGDHVVEGDEDTVIY